MQKDELLINKAADVYIDTDMTVMQLYPHHKKTFHYFMAVMTFVIFIPLTYLVFPLMVIFKFILYTPFYIILLNTNEADAAKLWDLKNKAFLFIQHLVYKLYYFHIGLWISCFSGFDDYWYGLDITKYRNHEDYLSSYRTSRVRWQFKKKLKTYHACGISEKIIPDHSVFYKFLFSYRYFQLIRNSIFRKNSGYEFLFGQFLIIRDYFLILFLPVRVHVYEKGGNPVGIATFLKRGNTVIMCQHIIDDDFIRSGIFYKQMNTCLHYAFHETGVLYVSCAATTRQAKQTSGCYPVNYLLTDEFKLKPFTQFKIRSNHHWTTSDRSGQLINPRAFLTHLF
ncbi:MAG TPA: hypothetical protein PLV50_06120 [Smithella sp.]|nr:hypothetical protein [Smithella sp.]HOG90092.1 hypothetical protein [Smithella sp.]